MKKSQYFLSSEVGRYATVYMYICVKIMTSERS